MPVSPESWDFEPLPAPKTWVDGFPAAVTSDMGVSNDLSDKGTGIGASRPWQAGELDRAAERVAAYVDPKRITQE